MRVFLGFIFFLGTICGSAGQDLSGHWQGYLTQAAGAPQTRYGFEMVLQQRKDKIEGTSTITWEQNFGTMRLSGTFEGKTFHFQETALLKNKILANFTWCIKKGTLALSEDEYYFYLQGPWEGYTHYSTCQPGYIWLRRKKTLLARTSGAVLPNRPLCFSIEE
ncbi:MAG: hypothetical protein HC913_21200 [Microscillaceae bacterium]|nr:hypothetical protein [Microscillaceae bacterium]